jgi:hypothetical protein
MLSLSNYTENGEKLDISFHFHAVFSRAHHFPNGIPFVSHKGMKFTKDFWGYFTPSCTLCLWRCPKKITYAIIWITVEERCCYEGHINRRKTFPEKELFHVVR